jgi:histidinol dehydrogenase
LFVALAKKHVYGDVAIDCIAGPSEIVVLADESAYPEFVAADLIAQAEHSPGSSILITWHEPLLQEILASLEHQLADLSRGDLARESLEQFGAFVVVRDAEDAVACANVLAAEHVHIAARDAEKLAEQIDNAGAIFLGHYSPVALGDYAAGPSHVLPTGGTARFTSGLSANDFLRRSSVLNFTRAGMMRLADDVRLLADKEGFTGHTASITARLGPVKVPPSAVPFRPSSRARLS